MSNKAEAHNHIGHHCHAHHSDATKGIGVAFFLNFGFCIIEIIGGLYTNSIAIITDAIHDFGDSLSLALAWYLQKYSKRKRNENYSYGYRRFALLGAIINSVVLLLGSVFVITECVKRLLTPEVADATGMLWLAIFGVLVNSIAIINLKKNKGLNARVVSLHLLEDVLGWTAILLASVVMLWVEVPLLDPILSLCISCYILFNVYKGLRDVLRIILQGTPDNIKTEEIQAMILAVPNVISIHDLHLWSMDGEFNIMSVHIVVSENLHSTDRLQLKTNVKAQLKDKGIHHCTLELEIEKDWCEFIDSCCE